MLPPSKLTNIPSKMMVGSDEVSFSNGPLFRRHLTHLKFNSSPLKIYLPNLKDSSSNYYFSGDEIRSFSGGIIWATKNCMLRPQTFHASTIVPPFFAHEAKRSEVAAYPFFVGPHFFSDIEELHKIKWDRHSQPPKKNNPFCFQK